jgi:alkaline phosphatase D
MRGLALIFMFWSCVGALAQVKKLNEIVSSLYDPVLKPFYHGVASGDPLPDRVIIWTRVTPEDSIAKISVRWEMSEDKSFRAVSRSGVSAATADKDYTVKIDVTGLKPGKKYYYRFSALNKTSMIGETKTTPTQKLDSLRFAVVSCSNWEFGYFNAYDRIAEKDVDAVIHLGDYIYEYQTGRYGNKNVDRKNLPAHETVSLSDYRTRYSQYHLDVGLRNVRQRHPMITTWDDHEIANNSYVSGAQNHQPEKEGDYSARKAAARRAYYEWIPVREGTKLYRKFSFGNLADIIVLDERLEGRTQQVDSLKDPTFNDPSRTMLGPEQLTWFENNLKSSQAAWQVIGNQVIFSDLDESFVHPRNPTSLDSWDGYPAEKRKIGEFILKNQINNIVFLAGDTHASWAFDVAVKSVTRYNPATSDGSLAIELGTPSVSSANANEAVADSIAIRRENGLMSTNSHLKFVNHRDHGYLLLTLYRDRGKAEWYYVETLMKPDAGEHLGKKMTFLRNSKRLNR